MRKVEDMKHISIPKIRKDHYEKTSGTALYTNDIVKENMVYGACVRSAKPHARILDIRFPEMPEGYTIVTEDDIPEGCGHYAYSKEDGLEIFASKEPVYEGQGIAMICGPDEDTVRRLVSETVVEYEDLPVVDDPEASDVTLQEYEYYKGDSEEAFKNAARVFEERFQTGYQEHMYIEPNGMIVDCDEEGNLSLIGSYQCPFYIRDNLAKTFNLRKDQIIVENAYIGGGFGSKENYPTLPSSQVAVAAIKLRRPVKMIMTRREDMLDSPKRHPCVMYYKAAVDENNNVTAVDADIIMDGGAHLTYSHLILQRCILVACGAYDVPNLHVRGRIKMTHSVPNDAFRGFGAPKSLFAFESMMNHMANALGEDPLEFKRRHYVKQGSSNTTNGRFFHPVILDQLTDRACELSHYKEKREAYAHQTGRFRKGIGLSVIIHGCGLTGDLEKTFADPHMELRKYKDGKVEILGANTDMGQGIKTCFAKIAAEILEIDLDDIITVNPNTGRVQDSGGTVASRSTQIPGRLVQDAAKKLKEIWKDGEEQSVITDYTLPAHMIPWDLNTFTGDPYSAYSWGINIVEVELDTLTGESHMTYGCAVYDVGTAIDERILEGQAQGGMIQGVGYASMERMDRKDGCIRQRSFTDYMVPTAMDVGGFDFETIDNPFEDGPFGAKGAGELVLVGGAPAFSQALEQASGLEFTNIPLTPEEVMRVKAASK